MASAAPADFAAMMPDVAIRLLGDPDPHLSRGDDLRWGTHGSLSVDRVKGTFYDHEAKAGGGVLDLIMRECRCDMAGAFRWLEEQHLKEPTTAANDDWRLGNGAKSSSAFYDYADEYGEVLYRVKRISKAGGGKTFLQFGPDGKGGFHAKEGCMRGVRRVPYRLPEMLAGASRTIFIVEGEKDADRLASLDFVATTNSEGALKFRDELVPFFAGRQVVIIPDNDGTGREHANDVANKLHGVAAKVCILELPGLPDKGDTSDWLDAGGTPDQLREFARTALKSPFEPQPEEPPKQVPLLDMIDAGDWEGIEVPERQWGMQGWEPRGSCILFTGIGASGKSLFTQQRMTCSAARLPFLGVNVTPGVSIYITCEDDKEELHRRQDAINAALGLTWSDLRGRLKLVSLKGKLNKELCTFGIDGMKTTARWEQIVASVRSIGATHVGLDNVAHFFSGNEIVRNQVAAFASLLDQLAMDIDGVVILLGHPNKNGEEYSGSTAWENQVRSRIYLSLPTAENGMSDPDARRLTNSKPNYSRRGEMIDFLWHKWAFVRPEDIPPNIMAGLAVNAQAALENARFLACLDELTEQKRSTSHSPNAGNYAPKIMAGMTAAKGMKRAHFKAAMERLFTLKQIAASQPLWMGADRKPVLGIARTDLRDGAGRSSVSDCNSLRDGSAGECGTVRDGDVENGENPCGTVRERESLYTTYIEGAAPEGTDAPSSQEMHARTESVRPSWLDEDDPAADEYG